MLARLPHRLDADTLPQVLSGLDIPMPVSANMLRASGQPLSATGYRKTVAQVDEALSKSGLSISERVAVKVAMANNQLLRR